MAHHIKLKLLYFFASNHAVYTQNLTTNQSCVVPPSTCNISKVLEQPLRGRLKLVFRSSADKRCVLRHSHLIREFRWPSKRFTFTPIVRVTMRMSGSRTSYSIVLIHNSLENLNYRWLWNTLRDACHQSWLLCRCRLLCRYNKTEHLTPDQLWAAKDLTHAILERGQQLPEAWTSDFTAIGSVEGYAGLGFHRTISGFPIYPFIRTSPVLDLWQRVGYGSLWRACTWLALIKAGVSRMRRAMIDLRGNALVLFCIWPAQDKAVRLKNEFFFEGFALAVKQVKPLDQSLSHACSDNRCRRRFTLVLAHTLKLQ